MRETETQKKFRKEMGNLNRNYKKENNGVNYFIIGAIILILGFVVYNNKDSAAYNNVVEKILVQDNTNKKNQKFEENTAKHATNSTIRSIGIIMDYQTRAYSLGENVTLEEFDIIYQEYLDYKHKPSTEKLYNKSIELFELYRERLIREENNQITSEFVDYYNKKNNEIQEDIHNEIVDTCKKNYIRVEFERGENGYYRFHSLL